MSTTFDIEIDWNLSNTSVPSHIDPDEVTDRTEAPLALSTFEAPVMGSDECVDLVKAESTVLASVGIDTSDKGLLFDAGTALAQSGHDALQAYDAAYKALPAASDAIDAYRWTVDAENRTDHVVDLAMHRINAAGNLDITPRIDGCGGIEPAKQAWRALTEIAGQNVNQGLSRLSDATRRIRTRDTRSGASREAYGIVSTDPTRGYAIFDGPQVADLLMAGLRDAGLSSGAKMELTYDRDTTRYSMRAIVQAPVDVPSFAGVGRVHQLFAQVSGGDDGNHAVKGEIGALRIRCLNATLVQAKGMQWSKTHRGQASEIRRLVSGMVHQFGTAADSLREVWTRAASEHYLATDGSVLSVREALTRLVGHGHISSGGLENDAAVDHYMAAWREEESPTSVAGILMAVQRAAHESTWATKWSTTEIEESASSLLYQPVRTLAEVR